MIDTNDRPLARWRFKIHEIIYEADTPAGKLFDVVLIICILASVLAVMIESMEAVGREYSTALRFMEWAFTGLFTVEYVLRIISVRQPVRYLLSFYGIVDLLAILPSYVSLFVTGSAHQLMVIRGLRILRIFRILKLAHFVHQGSQLKAALASSRYKITIFLTAVLNLALIFGAIMYLIEGPTHGFTSIPRGMYWAIVTMTTVGYGDISPQTPLGQALAACVMILGYGIIAVPTGIVSVELARTVAQISTQACPSCSAEGHDKNAKFCKFCGTELNPPESDTKPG